MERRLAAIVAMDMVGYTARMQADEVGTLTLIKSDRETLIEPKIAQYNGRTIKLMGDGALLEFPSVINAVQFAVEVQSHFKNRNSGLPEADRAAYRMGINIGDVIVEGEDVFGEGVNLAARLEGQAETGGICLSENVQRELKDRLDLDLEDRGAVEVKNVTGAVSIFFVTLNEKTDKLTTPIIPVAPPAQSAGKIPMKFFAAVAALIVIAAGLLWWQPWKGYLGGGLVAEAPLPDKPSIAVLPFVDPVGDKETAYQADGFTNAILTNLSKFPELFVVSGSSTFTYKGKQVKAEDVAKELGVQYVLLGTYQQGPEEIQVTAQLVDTLQNRNIWAEDFDVPVDLVIDVQEQLTDRIASTLSSVLVGRAQTRALNLKDAESLKAYDLYLRASKFKHGKDAMNQSIAELERAVELEPNFAAAQALLADRYVTAWRLNLSDTPKESLQKGREHAQIAYELDPQDYRTLNILCIMHLYADKAHDLALSECERAAALNPNDPEMLIDVAMVLGFKGRADEGLDWMARAKRQNPLYGPGYDWISSFLNTLAGNQEIALVEAERALVSFKNSLSLRRVKIFAYMELGEVEKAKAVAREILEINPDFTLKVLHNAPHEPPEQMQKIINHFRAAGLPDG